jgi:hypothetical protein
MMAGIFCVKIKKMGRGETTFYENRLGDKRQQPIFQYSILSRTGRMDTNVVAVVVSLLMVTSSHIMSISKINSQTDIYIRLSVTNSITRLTID